MNQLIENLSPLIGCKVDSPKWCPTTAYQVCKELRLASLICLDLEDDNFMVNGIEYKFKNKLTIETYNIYKKVMSFDDSILDTSYLIQVQDKINNSANLSINDALFFCATNMVKNDSAIFDCLNDLKELKKQEIYKYILFVLLDSYSLRYSLYNHYIIGDELDYGELRQERLDKLINNVNYIKKKLEEYNSNLSTDINHHLTTLLYNLCLIKKNLKTEYIEVDSL
ncbi:hypothetical protein NH288_04725 [Anaerococcus sp. NML200537]|uniref:hypothetical protein n=1 Tax=Anaerococcus sp. NML200537 TaxID=2954485 RepID=UPI002238A975|nr:hypothetical protein [Anaerococcus sp. NML200537]MCW6701387.1 hypothetical protein [Anaerococcus sp. NML200537]